VPIALRRWLGAAAILAITACARPNAAANFTLRDDGGVPWTLASQHGSVVLLTFGFTHCADTCPTTLAKLVHLATPLRRAGGKPIEIAFVTVDPQRDTPAALHRFVSRFSTSTVPVVGLTGTPAQIDAVENAYHVWAQRIPGRHGVSYDEAHTASIFFIDAGGAIRSLHDDDDPNRVLARAIREAAS